MPITWQNMAAPDFEGVNDLVKSSTNQITKSLSGLGKAAGGLAQVAQDSNTDEFLNRIKAAGTKADVDNLIASGDFSLDKLNGQYVDVSGILGALTKRKETVADEELNALKKKNELEAAKFIDANRSVQQEIQLNEQDVDLKTSEYNKDNLDGKHKLGELTQEASIRKALFDASNADLNEDTKRQEAANKNYTSKTEKELYDYKMQQARIAAKKMEQDFAQSVKDKKNQDAMQDINNQLVGVINPEDRINIINQGFSNPNITNYSGLNDLLGGVQEQLTKEYAMLDQVELEDNTVVDYSDKMRSIETAISNVKKRKIPTLIGEKTVGDVVDTYANAPTTDLNKWFGGIDSENLKTYVNELVNELDLSPGVIQEALIRFPDFTDSFSKASFKEHVKIIKAQDDRDNTHDAEREKLLQQKDDLTHRYNVGLTRYLKTNLTDQLKIKK